MFLSEIKDMSYLENNISLAECKLLFMEDDEKAKKITEKFIAETKEFIEKNKKEKLKNLNLVKTFSLISFCFSLIGCVSVEVSIVSSIVCLIVSLVTLILSYKKIYDAGQNIKKLKQVKVGLQQIKNKVPLKDKEKITNLLDDVNNALLE